MKDWNNEEVKLWFDNEFNDDRDIINYYFVSKCNGRVLFDMQTQQDLIYFVKDGYQKDGPFFCLRVWNRIQSVKRGYY